MQFFSTRENKDTTFVNTPLTTNSKNNQQQARQISNSRVFDTVREKKFLQIKKTTCSSLHHTPAKCYSNYLSHRIHI